MGISTLMFGQWLANVWPMFGRCLANVWPMFGRWLAIVPLRHSAPTIRLSAGPCWAIRLRSVSFQAVFLLAIVAGIGGAEIAGFIFRSELGFPADSVHMQHPRVVFHPVWPMVGEWLAKVMEKGKHGCTMPPRMNLLPPINPHDGR